MSVLSVFFCVELEKKNKNKKPEKLAKESAFEFL